MNTSTKANPGQNASRYSVRQICIIGILAAVGVVLSYFEIPLVPGNEYLKFDASDIPTVIATLVGGVVPAIFVALIKNAIHLMSTSTFGIGQLINFCMGITLALSVKFTYKKLINTKSKTFTYVITYIVTILAFVIVGAILNIALTPVFNALKGWPNNIELIIARVIQATFLNLLKPAITLSASFPIFLAIRRANLAK